MKSEPHNLPASQMIRVPTALVEVVRELSRLHRLGHTVPLLQELQALISRFDSSVEIEIPDEDLLKQVAATIVNLEKKLGSIETRLTHLEVGQKGVRKNQRNTSYFPTPIVELGAFEEKNLAKRLGVVPKTLVQQRQSSSELEFERWSRNKDPGQWGWRFKDDGLYYPVIE